ncbi:MAG: hypothetical protein JNK19_00020 [Tabrizicola sp.]|nr:hypothetical protein [Tabrizicola sp.]
MTATLRRALDKRPAATPVRTVLPLRNPPHRQTLSIRAALEWAFGTECASLDFAEDKGDNARPGVSPLWTVMQRGALGCKVDGGGWNPPAHDADIIASAVAHLPDTAGGRRMALRIAELARSGMAPDWGEGLRPRCIPVGWRCENQFGPQAVTEVVRIERITNRGRTRDFPVLACPVTYTASADTIACLRAQYQAWCEALAWLALDLRSRGILDRVTITAVLPDPEPWVTAGESRRAG